MPLGYGFEFEASLIDLEIYRLLAVVLASPSLAASAKRLPDDGRRLEWLRKIEFSEASRLLVSIAAIIRNGLDSRSRGSIELERPVGILFADLEKPTEYQDLVLREACNKILHALRVEPEVNDEGEDCAPSLKPLFNLYGTHREKEWRAVLDIREFAKAAVYFT